jgi:hypothetical protein
VNALASAVVMSVGKVVSRGAHPASNIEHASAAPIGNRRSLAYFTVCTFIVPSNLIRPCGRGGAHDTPDSKTFA